MNDPLVHVRGIHKDYRSGSVVVHALRGIDLDIERGEFLALYGPSGSGKSTLLNIIGCLDKPTRGAYLLGGNDVSGLGRRQLSEIRRDNLGFIFQSYNLIPVLTAFENVEFPLLLIKGLSARARRDRTERALVDVGLETMMHRRPAELSGGQQQRVAVARALVKEPLLVLADEPTANLDSETGQQLLTSMRELNTARGVTFLFSTHDHMVMRFARRLVRLQDGAIVKDERRDVEGSGEPDSGARDGAA